MSLSYVSGSELINKLITVKIVIASSIFRWRNLRHSEVRQLLVGDSNIGLSDFKSVLKYWRAVRARHLLVIDGTKMSRDKPMWFKSFERLLEEGRDLCTVVKRENCMWKMWTNLPHFYLNWLPLDPHFSVCAFFCVWGRGTCSH